MIVLQERELSFPLGTPLVGMLASSVVGRADEHSREGPLLVICAEVEEEPQPTSQGSLSKPNQEGVLGDALGRRTPGGHSIPSWPGPGPRMQGPEWPVSLPVGKLVSEAQTNESATFAWGNSWKEVSKPCSCTLCEDCAWPLCRRRLQTDC